MDGPALLERARRDSGLSQDELARRQFNATEPDRVWSTFPHRDTVLGDNTVAAAMLDRLLHRSVVLNLNGDSYRLRDNNARSEKLRKTTTRTRQPLL